MKVNTDLYFYNRKNREKFKNLKQRETESYVDNGCSLLIKVTCLLIHQNLEKAALAI